MDCGCYSSYFKGDYSLNLLDQMEQQGWDEVESEIEPEESTTFESSNQFSREDFENVTGLPAKMMKLTLFELVSRYGGPMQLDKWAIVLQKLSTTMERNQKTQERRNELIEKDFVISNVKKYLDTFMEGMFDLIESENQIIISSVIADPEKSKLSIKELRKKAVTKLSRETKKSIKGSIERLNKKYEDSDS